MKKATRQWLTSCSLLGALLTAGCVQMPTEKAGISDMRPQISFSALAESLHAARVSVDGMDTGTVGDYLANKSALRVLPGNHQIQVISSGAILLDEKTYLGDGVNRTFLVK